jgi:hypothetical protein
MSISTYAGLRDLGEAEFAGRPFQAGFRRCPFARLMLWTVCGRTVGCRAGAADRVLA